jgi:TPR repeat protein
MVEQKADQGDAVAQLKLGIIYITGEGAPADDVLAAAWFRKAVVHVR